MNRIAELPLTERDEIFQEAANRKGLKTEVIEKDFWVCWTLDKLFSLSGLSSGLIFKGGTSLSKVYNVIKRFSEDIDVSINRETLGFGGELDPLNISGSNQRKRAVEHIKQACSEKVCGEILSKLVERFSETLGQELWQLTVDEFDTERQTLLFHYPKDGRRLQNEYLPPRVKIEFGARAEHHPFEKHKIRPYAAEEFPELFEETNTQVKVLAPERTFWEKATILHDQFHRDQTILTADRISRHYYDLYQLSKSNIYHKALENIELLENVVQNKTIFFPRAGARYREALEGNLRLVPRDSRNAPLRADYAKMNEMFFSEAPSFEDIIKTLQVIESEINSTIIRTLS